MSKEKYCVSVDEVYGEGWLKRNREQLDQNWDWEFRLVAPGESCRIAFTVAWGLLVSDKGSIWSSDKPRIVLREKPKTDPVKEIYGRPQSECLPPEGYELTGEFRVPVLGEWFISGGGRAYDCHAFKAGSKISEEHGPDEIYQTEPRLILRKIEKPDPITKVYGKPLSELTAPDDWEFTGEFRKLEIGDYWLACPCEDHRNGAVGPAVPPDLNDTRLILRRKTPPKPTLKDVYGSDDPEIPAGWVSTGEFGGYIAKGEYWLSRLISTAVKAGRDYSTEENERLKIRRVTLLDIYGTAEVKIPAGYEWTGEFRGLRKGESWVSYQGVTINNACENSPLTTRLIIRPRKPKYIFHAEEKPRSPRHGDWYLSAETWIQANGPDEIYAGSLLRICATRHSVPDYTLQTVTQADIDRLNGELKD